MQDLVEDLTKFEEDFRWLHQHYDRLKSQYPEEYVAVFQKQVVDHDSSLEQLMRRLRAQYPQEVGRIVLEFVSTKIRQYQKVEYVL